MTDLRDFGIVEPKPEVELSLEQERAIDLCCDMKTLIAGVTGAAGTGKTLVLGKAYEQLSKNHLITLCAPTGRAAKRIQELTSIPAKTIHRLLQFPQPDDQLDDDGNPLPNEPRRNRMNPLDEEVIIVDEASMVGPTLYAQLMAALRPRSVVRFFGDNNQLQPVEEGTPPFIDILKRKPKVELMYNYRSRDHIVANANRILRGLIPQRNAQFEIIYSSRPTSTLYELVSHEKQFAGFADQIICPANKGRIGTLTMNPSLQLRFNPDGPILLLNRHKHPSDEKDKAQLLVRPGDKFLWTKNDYALGLYNGEIGTIEGLDKESGELFLTLEDREVDVPPIIKEFSQFHGSVIQRDPRKSIDLGYAITIHKAQGSEFDTVIIVMGASNGARLVHRNSFYTAVTRARHRVIVITDRLGMSRAMRKHQPM